MENTQSWSQLASSLDFGYATWQFAEYNPVHHVMVFGNASGTKKMWKISTSGQVAQLYNLPITLYEGSAYAGVFTVDPVSGDYLALTAVNRQFYTYNVLTDTWTLCSNQPSSVISSLANSSMIATPVNTYGVKLVHVLQ
jgi:hypothetical protein